MTEKESKLAELKKAFFEKLDAIDDKTHADPQNVEPKKNRLDTGKTRYSEVTGWYMEEARKIEEQYGKEGKGK